MANRDIVAIGTSAGGVQALLFLTRQLPRDFPASIVVTIHLAADFRSSLDELLSRNGPLPAVFATNGAALQKGHIYIAPPGCHMLIDGRDISLGVGPRENNSRPAIDPMLRSIGVCCAGRAVGVVLTGTLGDGAAGLSVLGELGGITVVQDPRDAAYPGMPQMALKRFEPDHVVALAEMPRLLESLVHQPAGEPRPAKDQLKFEVEIARSGRGAMSEMDRIGRRSVMSCPDCGGVMREIDDDGVIRFRCHTGHAYTADHMALALDENLRRALASALRALDERGALMRKLQEQASGYGRSMLAESWASKAREIQRETKTIEDAIWRLDQISTQEVAAT